MSRPKDGPKPRKPKTPRAGPELKYQTGNIVLPNKVATLHLGEKYRYLDPNETNQLLHGLGQRERHHARRAPSSPPTWIR